MAQTYLTGDIHGYADLLESRLDADFPGLRPSEDDVLLILGDAGVVWDTGPDAAAEGVLDPLDAEAVSELERTWPGYILFLDGNHENHDALRRLPKRSLFGATVGVVSGRVFHLRRGCVYGLPAGGDRHASCFVLGGAWSIDWGMRTPGIDWWATEIPSRKELDRAWTALAGEKWSVDYVLTHECPTPCRERAIWRSPFGPVSHRDQLMDFLDEVEDRVNFERWYFGHYHEDIDIDDSHTLLFERVVRLGDALGTSV